MAIGIVISAGFSKASEISQTFVPLWPNEFNWQTMLAFGAGASVIDTVFRRDFPYVIRRFDGRVVPGFNYIPIISIISLTGALMRFGVYKTLWFAFVPGFGQRFATVREAVGVAP